MSGLKVSDKRNEEVIEGLHAAMDISSYRAKIDDIDDQIHKLLIDRMGMMHMVKPIKEKYITKGSHIRAERGVEVIRNAYKHLKHHYPKEAIITIWRALISSSEFLERPFVIATSNESCYWLAREFYGTHMHHEICRDSAHMLELIRGGKAQFGSALFPSFDSDDKWWFELIDDPVYKVYAVYPFHQDKALRPALWIGEVVLLPTGDDLTLVALQGSEEDITSKISYKVIDSHCGYLLLLVDGFIAREELVNITSKKAVVLGIYGAPIRDDQ